MFGLGVVISKGTCAISSNPVTVLNSASKTSRPAIPDVKEDRVDIVFKDSQGMSDKTKRRAILKADGKFKRQCAMAQTGQR
jgi:hypothetical protein